MALEKAPAFQFYPKDFLMDGNVSGMSLQERGAYITLLCICWLEGSLPADVGRLANIVGTPRKAFAKFWPAIAICFQERGDRLMHGRLEIEREKQAEYRRRQSDAGNASAARRQPKAQPNGNRGSTTVQPQTQPDPQPKGNSPSPISDLRSPKEQIHARVSLTPADEITERAGRFCEHYGDLYLELRHGARYLPRPALDFQKAVDLCQVWPDDRLDKLARVFLKTDHDFAVSGSRTIGQFAALASWCDDRLREVESKHAVG